MNPAVPHENSPFRCSPTSTRDAPFVVEKNPHIRKRTMPVTVTVTLTPSVADDCTKVLTENKSQQYNNFEKGGESGLSRGRPFPSSLTNLRAQLNSSASSASSTVSEKDESAASCVDCDLGNMSPVPAAQQKNTLRRKNNMKSPPTPAAPTQKHRQLKKQQQQHQHQQHQQHYQERQDIFRRCDVITPLRRPFKQQRSFSPSPRTANYDTERMRPELLVHRGECNSIISYQNSSESQESSPSLSPSSKLTLPSLWTDQFSRGVTNIVKEPVDRMIGKGNLPLDPRRKFLSRLNPLDIVRSIHSESEDEDHEINEEDEEELYDVLGCGSFSSVTRVRIRGSGKICYALKHLKQDLLPSRLTMQSLKNGSITAFTRAATELAREAYLLSRLDHANIINIVGWAEGGVESYANFRRHDAFFLVLELLQEETLDDRIERWNYEDAQVVACSQDKRKSHFIQRKIEQLTICRQVAGALAYIHSKNVVYRDLKPQNIGFAIDKSVSDSEENDGSNVVVKLMDFGLARELPSTGTVLPKEQDLSRSPKTETSVFDMTGTVGTLRYMAPEVCLHLPYGLECDIYSWSIVAHEILSQAKPYEEMTPNTYQTLVCHQGVRPHRLDLPSEYFVLLSHAWRMDPSKRLPLDRIQQQLDLFLQKEKLIWEAQELLSGMPESNECPITLSRSFAEKNTNGQFWGEERRANKRRWNEQSVRSNNSHNGIFPSSSVRCFDGAHSKCLSPSPNGPIVANNSYSYSPDSYDGDQYARNNFVQHPHQGYYERLRDAGSPGRFSPSRYSPSRHSTRYPYEYSHQPQQLSYHPQDLMIPQHDPNSYASNGRDTFSTGHNRNDRKLHLKVRPSERNQAYYENSVYGNFHY
mmetsp:Transcript_16846/g.38620  ORF Transcript_16846/g.38620 Transcript_16846/m.38620 type:complete len:868 (-) Transcript_16846:101-2704(-)|eukprot:CAMPEP_0172392392 /NCGR_PEP_ID=MMETSP1061-20121228/8539_1 /TAXON_ID=37318 /ORGANISM="Pseudo-nitzschia pungens, Strain cf. pungens" /LENGTH=867 /DNA_ID=CAMNT_0013123229 /DNA_START=158 /DNA_END=2761 /DNA_ORIENTATION=+